MFNFNEIMNKAMQALREKFGDDFKLKDGDQFVFSLHNCALYIEQEDGCLLSGRGRRYRR